MKTYMSIKTQLILIILAVTLFSTLMAFSFSIIYDYTNSYDDLKNSMRFTAHLIAENCKSPLLFNDSHGAQELLSSFSSMPMVLYAAVLDTNDSVFSHYSKTSSHKPIGIKTRGEEESYFDNAGLHIIQPIEQENQPFGHLIMHVSTETIVRKIQISSGIFFSVFFLIMLISYFVALKLQRIISEPILQLKNVAEQITHHSDYSIRIPHTHQNEVGLLQISFDTMVQQLNKNILSLKNEIDYRIRSQQEALQLRLYLKNIMDSISSVIIAVDHNGRIQQINKEALRFLSISAESILHQLVTEVVPIIEGKEELLKRCMEENSPQKIALVYIHPGDQRQLNLNVAIFPLSQNQNQGMVILIDDVTDRTRMESMMIQNEKMMSLGGLAAGMAHEINNPLGIISQGIQNIVRHVSPDFKRNCDVASELNLDINSLYHYLEKRKVLHYLEGMLSASKRASEIVANMLQFSRMSNQSKTPANIKEVINQTIELAQNEYELKKKFDFRQITICREFEEEMPEILCNVTEIQQVVLNLLKNAAHALYEKKCENFIPQILIRINHDKTHAKIEIQDNGPGIPDEFRKRIFEPFFTTKEVGIGTGLGLSVSFFIITKNHAGTIEFESESGKGTCFKIRIPFTHSQTT